MNTSVPKLTEQEVAQRLQAAKNKAARVNDKIVGFEATKQQLQRQLSEYEQEAKEKFGTCNLDEMRALYREQVETQTRELLIFESDVEANLALIQQIDIEAAKIEEKYAR